MDPAEYEDCDKTIPSGSSGKDSELWAEAVDPAEYEDCDKTTPSGSSGNADIWAEAVDPADYEDCDKTPIGDDNDNAVTSWAEAAADSGEDADCSSNSVVSADNRPQPNRHIKTTTNKHNSINNIINNNNSNNDEHDDDDSIINFNPPEILGHHQFQTNKQTDPNATILE